jgi:hypothetical protein
MRGDTVTAVIQQRNIPEAIHSLSTLASPDYVDFFTATAGQTTDKSPEQWARDGLEGPPLARVPLRVALRLIPLRLVGQLAWRVLLGLHLGPRYSPGYIAGWKIADRGDNWITMEAAGFVTANIVFRVDEGRVDLATFVRYDRRIAVLVWPLLSLLHRRLVPVVLRRAVKVKAR